MLNINTAYFFTISNHIAQHKENSKKLKDPYLQTPHQIWANNRGIEKTLTKIIEIINVWSLRI